MSCKFYKKIIAALMVLSLASTVAILAYAEGDNDTPPPVASSSQGSTISSDNTGSASSVDGGVSSDNTPAASSSAVGPSSVISAVTSSKKTPTAASSKVTSSKKPKTNSSKAKPSSRVYSSAAAQSYSAGTVSVDQYNDGSKSDTWEGGSAGVEVVSSKAVSSGKALSKHLTNPKKEILKLIWIPVLIALACIGVLLYTNLYLYKKKAQKHVPKHSAKAQKKAARGADKKDEGAADKKVQKDDDPFSAENFFHFDDN